VSLGSNLRDEDVDGPHRADQASGSSSAALLRLSSLAASILALIRAVLVLGLFDPLAAACLLEGVGPAGARWRSGSGLWIWAFG
jgi:hypothetical protein